MERRFSRPRFDNRGPRGGFEKPVKVGETYDVEINEIGSRGDGIARVKNFVIFVANTKKGEKCKIKINQVSRRFAIGEKVGKEEAVKEVVEEEKTEEKPVEEVVEESLGKEGAVKEVVEEESLEKEGEET